MKGRGRQGADAASSAAAGAVTNPAVLHGGGRDAGISPSPLRRHNHAATTTADASAPARPKPAGHDAAAYGELMPPGGPLLTRGELEFIRAWILAGAPRKGVVADPALLADTYRPMAELFSPPPPPASGLQLRLGPFAVSANFEREVFYYQPLNNDADLFVNRIEAAGYR